jgi:hypothetical protein
VDDCFHELSSTAAVGAATADNPNQQQQPRTRSAGIWGGSPLAWLEVRAPAPPLDLLNVEMRYYCVQLAFNSEGLRAHGSKRIVLGTRRGFEATCGTKATTQQDWKLNQQ